MKNDKLTEQRLRHVFQAKHIRTRTPILLGAPQMRHCERLYQQARAVGVVAGMRILGPGGEGGVDTHNFGNEGRIVGDGERRFVLAVAAGVVHVEDPRELGVCRALVGVVDVWDSVEVGQRRAGFDIGAAQHYHQNDLVR